MLRILVDIAEGDIRALDALAEREDVSRASVIRRATRAMLTRKAGQEVESTFGLWGADTPDGLAYQEELRSEW